MNYAGELDVYRLWAEVILKQQASYSKLRRYSAGFDGQKEFYQISLYSERNSRHV